MAWWYDQKLGILLLCLLALSLTVSLSLSVTKLLVERLCNCRVYHTGTDYRQDYRELTILCESGQTSFLFGRPPTDPTSARVVEGGGGCRKQKGGRGGGWPVERQ